MSYLILDLENDNPERDLIYPRGVSELQVVNKITAGTTINANAVFDLNGNAQTLQHLAGSGTVDNTSATAATLTLGGANDATVGTFAGVIQQSGGGVVSLTKSDTTLETLTGTANTFTGTLTVNNGSLTLYSLANSGTGSNGTGTIQIGNNANSGVTMRPRYCSAGGR